MLNMIQKIAFFIIFGQPLIVYIGIITMICILFTATVGFLNYKGIKVIPFKWHLIFAVTTITLALAHGLFGLSMILDF
jgi:hypothetical protein